jgi:uncharacterized protein
MMSLRKALRQSAQQQMQQDPAHDLAHLDRVWINAQLIANSFDGVNLRVLLGAAYLHDLVNLPKDAPNRCQASALSAKAAAPILRGLGFSTAEIDAAGNAITAHSFSAKIPPESIEAEILRDADRLDALGAIGIARTFVVAGATGRALYDPADPFATNRALDDQIWAIDHWQAKLLQLPNDMLTTKGCEIAEMRAHIMLDYLSQLSDEITAPLADSHVATAT